MNPPYTDMSSYFMLREREGGRGERIYEQGLQDSQTFCLPVTWESAGSRAVLPASPLPCVVGREDVLKEASIFLEHRKALHKEVGCDRGSPQNRIASGTTYYFSLYFSYNLGGRWWNRNHLTVTNNITPGILGRHGVCVCLTIACEVGSLVNKAFVCFCEGAVIFF